MKSIKQLYQEAAKLIGKDKLNIKLRNFLLRLISKTKKHLYAQGSNEQSVSFDEQISTIIQHLNNVTGLSFRETTQNTRQLIRSRLNDKFTVDDFKKVHTIKARKWLGTEKQIYLRPSTLYSVSKFEGYLQEFYLDQNEKKSQKHKKQTVQSFKKPGGKEAEKIHEILSKTGEKLKMKNRIGE